MMQFLYTYGVFLLLLVFLIAYVLLASARKKGQPKVRSRPRTVLLGELCDHCEGQGIDPHTGSICFCYGGRVPKNPL